MARSRRSTDLRTLAWAALASLTLLATAPACAQAAEQAELSQIKVKTLAIIGFDLNTDTPSSPLILATYGNYYGSTTHRALLGEGDGSVYRMTRQGAVTIVHTFQVESFPHEVMQASDGRLYGTSRPDESGTHAGDRPSVMAQTSLQFDNGCLEVPTNIGLHCQGGAGQRRGLASLLILARLQRAQSHPGAPVHKMRASRDAAVGQARQPA